MTKTLFKKIWNLSEKWRTSAVIFLKRESYYQKPFCERIWDIGEIPLLYISATVSSSLKVCQFQCFSHHSRCSETTLHYSETTHQIFPQRVVKYVSWPAALTSILVDDITALWGTLHTSLRDRFIHHRMEEPGHGLKASEMGMSDIWPRFLARFRALLNSVVWAREYWSLREIQYRHFVDARLTIWHHFYGFIVYFTNWLVSQNERDAKIAFLYLILI